MIYGQRIRLRHIERTDLEKYLEWINDPEVRHALATFLPMSMAEEEIWFEASLERDPLKRPFAIELNENGEWIHIGGCGFHEINERARHAELGIMIGAKEYWGQGLGADVMSTLMEYGFSTLNFRRIYLRVFEFNQRGLGLYKKLGFVEEGRLRQDCFRKGRYWDTILMGMLRSEWQELNPQEE
jgi:RimJ/RimL family protein N-acetyltransferase